MYKIKYSIGGYEGNQLESVVSAIIKNAIDDHRTNELEEICIATLISLNAVNLKKYCPKDKI